LNSYVYDSLGISNNKLEKDSLPVGKNAANNSTMQQPNNSGSSSNSNLGGNSSNPNLGGNSSNPNLGGNSSNVVPASDLSKKAYKALNDAHFWNSDWEFHMFARDEYLNANPQPHPLAPREVQEQWRRKYVAQNFEEAIHESTRNSDSEYRKYEILQKKINGEYTMHESSSQSSSTKHTMEDSSSSSKKRRDN
jgi:hypothetical protein